MTSKAREALQAVVDCAVDGRLKITETAWEKVMEALREPIRNCDVGTTEEQWRRWRIFCDSTSCNSCPCQSEYEPSAVCFCRWAQMPYESEVDNAEK